MVERFEQSKLTKPKEAQPKVKQAILAVLYTACAYWPFVFNER